MKKRIWKAALELDYHPNAVAVNFARKRSGNIGVVVPYIPSVHIFSVYYFSELLSGIGDALEKKGYDLVLFFNRDTQNGLYERYFKSGKVDGCILLGTREKDPGLESLKRAGYQFCLINNYSDDGSMNFYDVDNEEGASKAVSYLIKLGHKRICCLNGPLSFRNSTDRLKGYKKALQENGINFDPGYLLEGNYGRKSGYQAADRLLKLDPLPTAVFASNDRMAAGLIQGLKEKGIKIPEDISIVGYDDSDMAVMVEPHLTTIRIPFFEMGKGCAEEFIELLNDRRAAFKRFMEPELIIRDSACKI